MGRPKPVREEKTYASGVRLSEAVIKLIDKRASETGETRGGLMRSLILNGLGVDEEGQKTLNDKERKIEQLQGKVEALMELLASKN